MQIKATGEGSGIYYCHPEHGEGSLSILILLSLILYLSLKSKLIFRYAQDDKMTLFAFIMRRAGTEKNPETMYPGFYAT